MAQQLATPAENRTGRLKGFSQHWFKFAQRLSQALLVPIAILPAAGVMKGLASTPTGILSPSLNELFATTGNLIFTMMPLLFAIAIAIGFCRDQGIAAFSAAFGFGVFLIAAGLAKPRAHFGLARSGDHRYRYCRWYAAWGDDLPGDGHESSLAFAGYLFLL